MTQDSQMVYLKDNGTWDYMGKDSAIVKPDFKIKDLPEIKTSPYPVLEGIPKPISEPVPKYPDEAKKEGIEGTVIVKILVDIDGTVADVEIFKSSGSALLDQAAVDAALQAKYKPAERYDKSKKYNVRAWVYRPYKFNLQ
jgi:TonB family protein